MNTKALQSNVLRTVQVQVVTRGEERQLCARFAHPSWGRALWQLGSTLASFALLWWVMAWSVYSRWGHGWTLLLVLPAAGLYVRLFIIQHDCGHGSYFSSRRANQWVGACLGLLRLFPFGYWRKTHAVHHATSGNLDRRELGDIRTLTVAEYQERSSWGRFLYRSYRSMPVLLGLGPAYQFLVKRRLPVGLPLSWRKEWASVLLNDLMLLIAVGADISLLDLRTLLQCAPRLTLSTSFGCARLKLWGEERGCMVGLVIAKHAGPARAMLPELSAPRCPSAAHRADLR